MHEARSKNGGREPWKYGHPVFPRHWRWHYFFLGAEGNKRSVLRAAASVGNNYVVRYAAIEIEALIGTPALQAPVKLISFLEIFIPRVDI